MELKKVIERLENYQQWRRDQNVPPKVEMQSPIEIGAAIDYAISELKKLLLADVNGSVCPDCLMGRDEFDPKWECPECRRKTDR